MPASETFGSFFRSTRKAIGLSLREFCRRNGFDPGNISRLERGLVRPPQSPELLESYAKALRLDESTEARDRFFDLAATEAGRIPDEVLKDRIATEKLPKILQGLRLRGRRSPSGVTALQLESWADTLDARSTLPRLVRRLARATGKGVQWMEFPAGEQVQRPGWDGVVRAGSGDVYVPAGTSVWEMGVDKDPRKKAEDDFVKRSKAPRGFDRSEAVFIFVTPRKWQAKDDWCRSKAEDGGWREVRVYDSTTLEEWLEQAPAVEAWMSGLLGVRPSGVTTLEEYWENTQELTNPSLAPEVFLASREDQVKELDAWLKGRAGALAIEARSPAEAIDFVVGHARVSSQSGMLAARALIIEDRDAWRTMAARSEGGLLLIAAPSLQIEPELVAETVRRGHQAITASVVAQREAITTLKLPRAYRPDLEKALRDSGLKEERANWLAREAGGSLTVLKRLLARYPGTTRPKWSTAAELVPLLLAGAWSEDSEADRTALEELSGKPYSEVSEVAKRWLDAPDSPLTRIGSRLRLLSRDDSWFLLGSRVSSENRHRLEDVALKVLAQDDPALKLPPEKRWREAFTRKKEEPRYSSALRQGLAETLAILGARPEQSSSLVGLHDLPNRVVRELLNDQGWLRWASLESELTLLAEAAPEAFLKAVERDLKQTRPSLLKLFQEDGSHFFTSQPQTGLLQALKVLAWNHSLLSRVSRILVKLDELAPRNNSGDSPFKSLVHIFMPWYPQTAASAEERVKVLRRLMEKTPDGGWRLLVDLLPSNRQISVDGPYPLWRDWSLSRPRGTTNVEYWRQVSASAELLIEKLGDDVSRWRTLIENFEDLPPPARTEFINRLKEFAEELSNDDERRALTEVLKDKVAKHRRFSATGWALPEEVLAELDQARGRFEPRDIVKKNAWLFRNRWQVMDALDDGKDCEARVDAMRRAALSEILDQHGWDGVLRLVAEAEAAEEVGTTLADVKATEHEARILPSLLVSPDEKLALFAKGYAWGRWRKSGMEWLGSLEKENWSADQLGQVLALPPFKQETWDFVAAQGAEVEDWYWGKTPIFSRGNDAEEAKHAVNMLLKHNRPAEAINVLGMAMHDNVILEPSLLMDALRGHLEHGDFDYNNMNRYNIYLIIQNLQEMVKAGDPKIDIERLAELEWAYLALLDDHPASPITLRGLLRDRPDFFVGVLALIFRPKSQKNPPEPTETEKQRAHNAYRLLLAWQDVPGQREDQSIDEETLSQWVKTALDLAKEKDILEVAESRIGQVLAWAPGEADGSWPCIAVRDVLEDIESEEMFSGFLSGIYNKRGMVSRSIREGGAQDRALAEEYRKYAESCHVDWPLTAASLRLAAEYYEEDARRADIDSELMLE